MSEMEQQPICKIALGIEYDGSKYYGWQRQNEVRSVQEKLEKALSQVANEPITVFCAAGAIAFAEQIDFTLLFFYRAFHLASAGIGLPAICDCTWATIRDSAA